MRFSKIYFVLNSFHVLTIDIFLSLIIDPNIARRVNNQSFGSLRFIKLTFGGLGHVRDLRFENAF